MEYLAPLDKPHHCLRNICSPWPFIPSKLMSFNLLLLIFIDWYYVYGAVVAVVMLVCRGLGWGTEGSWCIKCVLVVGDMPGHLQRTDVEVFYLRLSPIQEQIYCIFTLKFIYIFRWWSEGSQMETPCCKYIRISLVIVNHDAASRNT